MLLTLVPRLVPVPVPVPVPALAGMLRALLWTGRADVDEEEEEGGAAVVGG